METRQLSSLDSAPHLLSGAARLVRNMFGLLLNRIELAALELSEVRTNFLKLALIFGLGIVVVWFAIGYWSAVVVMLSWDALGWKILAIIAAVFTGLAVWLFSYARALLDRGKLSMPVTMAELRSDGDALL
ncbi:MAG TPA: hypothetical protein DIT28_12450 [Oxalobacteraceae bacterium]|nr:hypothetical protein [Oxalobacteraceae bacterium]